MEERREGKGSYESVGYVREEYVACWTMDRDVVEAVELAAEKVIEDYCTSVKRVSKGERMGGVDGPVEL
jgi:hypothetical protein